MNVTVPHRSTRLAGCCERSNRNRDRQITSRESSGQRAFDGRRLLRPRRWAFRRRIVAGARADLNTGAVDLHVDPVEPAVTAVVGLEAEQIVRTVLAEHLRDEFRRRVRVRDGAPAGALRERPEIAERLRRRLEPVWIELIHVDVRMLERSEHSGPLVGDCQVGIRKALRDLTGISSRTDQHHGLAHARPRAESFADRAQGFRHAVLLVAGTAG